MSCSHRIPMLSLVAHLMSSYHATTLLHFLFEAWILQALSIFFWHLITSHGLQSYQLYACLGTCNMLTGCMW